MTNSDFEVGTRVQTLKSFPTSNVTAGEEGVVEAHHTNGITVRWNQPDRFKTALDWTTARRELREI